MSTDFEILHSLRVKGLAKPEILSALSGVSVDDLPGACARLVDSGDVVSREGAMAGYMLSGAGKETATQRLLEDEETNAAKDDLAEFDGVFLPINTAFKKICHAWQMKDEATPNDHADEVYDAQVVSDLADLHERIVGPLDQLARALPRFARYAPRLAHALERVQRGDTGSFARPMYDSYHDIWMELHNDVILSLGRERGGADEDSH